MAIKFDTKKGAEMVSGFLKKTSEVGKNAAEGVQKSATALSEKMKEDSYQRRLKKYNPLFPDEYQSVSFNLPNMIVIVDDAVRRGIDVCEGAIGWRDTQGETEILYLYDEAIKLSGIQFIPSATCDTIYYVDNFNRNRFIQVDCIFSKAHEERLAELKNVAHALGAKSCTIEISESTTEHTSFSKKATLSGNVNTSDGVSCNQEQSSVYMSSNTRSGKITAQFEGNNEPHRPKLKWFAHDENIKKLIDMRCKNSNALKSEILELSGASSATMSRKTAISIDGAMKKMGIKSHSSMESHAITESSSKLIFSVEF